MTPKKKTSAPGSLLPPKSGVRIRMYNTGFGDCFLLAFPAGQGVFYMLIDCGVHHRFEDGDVQIQKVARDIAAATGGHLDIGFAGLQSLPSRAKQLDPQRDG